MWRFWKLWGLQCDFRKWLRIFLKLNARTYILNAGASAGGRARGWQRRGCGFDSAWAREAGRILADFNQPSAPKTASFWGARRHPCALPCAPAMRPGCATWRSRVPQPATHPLSSADTWQHSGAPKCQISQLLQPISPINSGVSAVNVINFGKYWNSVREHTRGIKLF